MKKLITLVISSSLFAIPLITQAQDSAVFANGEPSDAFLYQLKDSIVKVSSTQKNGGHGYGTGVAITKDHVVTNCHTLQSSNGISITKWGEAFAPVALIADWKHDICILRFEWANLKPTTLGDSEHLRVEQPIISISMPGDSPAPYVTLGKIKATYPMDDAHVIRATAAFAIGASGSPVFDYDGKLIAISTLKSPGQNAYYYNMPVQWVKAALKMPEVPVYTIGPEAFWDAPDEARPYFMRVVLPYQNGHWEELKTVAQSWLATEPNNIEALYYAGIAEQRLSDLSLSNPSKAKQYFQQVLKIQPQHPATLIELGLIANKAGNVIEVEKTRVALKAIDSELDAEFTAALKPAQ